MWNAWIRPKSRPEVSRAAYSSSCEGADPRMMLTDSRSFSSSLIRAAGMLLAHIGFVEKKELLEQAMDICTVTERKVVLTTFTEDASTREFTDYVIETIQNIRK